MIPIIFAEAIQNVTVEQAQGLWMDGTIDRVRLDGADYFMAADMALTLADQGLLHEDAFVARAGIKKGGGACGRGWVGVKGSCKRITKGGGDRASQHKAALKEFAQNQRFKGSSKGTQSLVEIGMGKHQEAARSKQSEELGKLIREKAGKRGGKVESNKNVSSEVKGLRSIGMKTPLTVESFSQDVLARRKALKHRSKSSEDYSSSVSARQTRKRIGVGTVKGRDRMIGEGSKKVRGMLAREKASDEAHKSFVDEQKNKRKGKTP